MKNKLKFKTIDINKKKIIIAILSVFIITVGIMIIRKAYSTTSPLDNQVVEGLSFENVNFDKKDGITTFECEVINDNSFIVWFCETNHSSNEIQEIITNFAVSICLAESPKGK